MSSKAYIAVDIGASSGRVLAGSFDGQQLKLDEVHRFENGGVLAHDRMYWDLLGLWREVKNGLRAAATRYRNIASIGVDTWGVDFGILGDDDELLGNPRHYRDRHTEGIMASALKEVSRSQIFAETGLQFMPFNTIYQLIALQRAGSPVLSSARRFLMMPDLFHWLMTGVQGNEYTNATTTQLFNPTTRKWSSVLLEKFNLPAAIFGDVIEPGTTLGRLRKQVAEETGLHATEVVLPGTHDTASAVLAVPAAGEPSGKPNWCYLSSGTWSLMGAEIDRPIIHERCLERNFTNEGGVGGTIRLLKNIAGLWLIQECRRIWKQAGRELSWEQLVQQATQAPRARSLIDPDHPRFLAPADMPQEIAKACADTGQPVPQSEGEIIRCALDSLALRYRTVLQWTEELTGANIETIHVVGGGVQNVLLCQMTADACNRRVLAGPVEATALGNVMMQAVSCGEVHSIPEARQMIARSFVPQEYLPHSPAAWDEPFARFSAIVSQMATS